jgi:ABC-type maltose transport system permease subunit
LSAWRLPNPFATNPLTTIESFLKRDESDVLLIAGNVVLVALEIIEWPVAVLTLAAHAMARSRIKALQAVAELAEEGE